MQTTYSFLQNPQVQLICQKECTRANFVIDVHGRLLIKWDHGSKGFMYQEVADYYFTPDTECVIDKKETIRTKSEMVALKIADTIGPFFDICGARAQKSKMRYVLVLSTGEKANLVVLKAYFPQSVQ